ncbi:hypothetical protein JCM10213_004065 [Rhodosporidiobolus nylandii]
MNAQDTFAAAPMAYTSVLSRMEHDREYNDCYLLHSWPRFLTRDELAQMDQLSTARGEPALSRWICLAYSLVKGEEWQRVERAQEYDTVWTRQKIPRGDLRWRVEAEGIRMRIKDREEESLIVRRLYRDYMQFEAQHGHSEADAVRRLSLFEWHESPARIERDKRAQLADTSAVAP